MFYDFFLLKIRKESSGCCHQKYADYLVKMAAYFSRDLDIVLYAGRCFGRKKAELIALR